MRAAVLDSFGGDVVVRNVPDPVPGPGEVLVVVEACGVGLTLERARTGALGGTAPRIVGHELGGTVAAIGPGVPQWQPGHRVTASFYLTCGACEFCAGGRETLCTNWKGYVGTHIDGALAEAMVLPAASLVRVPDEVGLDEAAIAADAIATPYHVFTARAPLRPGQTVAVIGAGGGVGIHTAAMARAFGARVVAVERDADKQKRLGECGFDLVWSPGDDPDWAGDLIGVAGGKVDVTLDLVAQRRVEPVIGARFDLDDTAEAYRVMQANQAFGRIVVQTRRS